MRKGDTALRILIVEDDDDFRQLLKDQLILQEFDVLAVSTGEQAIATVKSEHLNLVLLDVGLPNMDGREVCKVLRKNGFKAPIVMLTGNKTDAETILGLEAGASDYVTKPFKLGVLLARMRAQLRRHEKSDEALMRIGCYSFKPSSKMLVDAKGSKIRLTEKESLILKHLYRAAQKVVPRTVLLHDVWGYNSRVNTHTLETHIYCLRRKIEEDPSHPELLVTDGGGYKLIK